jgi:ribosomal protein S21
MFRGVMRAAMPPLPIRTVLATRILSLPKPKPFSTTSLLRQSQQDDGKAALPIEEANPASSTPSKDKSDDSFSLFKERSAKPKPKDSPKTVSFVQDLRGPSSSSSSSSKTKGGNSADAWAELEQLGRIVPPAPSKGLELNSNDIQAIRSNGSSPQLYTHSATEPLSDADKFEDAWRYRYLGGPARPRKPRDGRVFEVRSNVDVGSAYSRLMSLLAKNNVRRELRLEENYEKPNQKRRRLKSERHRRRFAAAVREKVQLVSVLQRER